MAAERGKLPFILEAHRKQPNQDLMLPQTADPGVSNSSCCTPRSTGSNRMIQSDYGKRNAIPPTDKQARNGRNHMTAPRSP